MKILKVLLLAAMTCSCPTFCFGQSFWQDYSSAIPKVLSPMGTPIFNLPSQGFPSTSGYQNNPLPGQDLSGGVAYNPNLYNGAGPMLAPARKDWKLGVYVDNREEGAVITQVVPGSAGQQAGLQPNDVIVAVGRARIGSFDNRIIELADEIGRNADSMGRVSLLVFNARQRTLVPLLVSMNSTSTTLTGIAAIRDRMQLPSGSVLVVQLLDVSNPYNLISGGKSVTRADGVGPYSFELYVDPRTLDPRDQYQLTAAIVMGSQTIYSLPQPVSVNLNNLGRSMNLLLEQVAGGPSYGNVGQPNYSQSNVVNVGYPGMGIQQNELNNLFLQLLNRSPSAAEAVAWQSYLQQGNSINDLKIKLMSNIKFRERFTNDTAYVQHLISVLTTRAPDQQELSFWTSRLQATQSPDTVIREILQRNR